MPPNIPNLLTWARILLIPLFGRRVLRAAAPAGAGRAEPRRDRHLRRRGDHRLAGRLAGAPAGQTSAFSAFLDPVADKLMVAAALVVLVQLGRADAVVAFIIVGREITISALREWMAKIGAGRSVAVSFVGKLKTTAQMIAIPMLLYHEPLGPIDPQSLGTWLIYAAAILTLW